MFVLLASLVVHWWHGLFVLPPAPREDHLGPLGGLPDGRRLSGGAPTGVLGSRAERSGGAAHPGCAAAPAGFNGPFVDDRSVSMDRLSTTVWLASLQSRRKVMGRWIDFHREARSRLVDETMRQHGVADDGTEASVAVVHAILQLRLDSVVHPMLSVSPADDEQLAFWEDMTQCDFKHGREESSAYRFHVVNGHALQEPVPLIFMVKARVHGLVIHLEAHQTPRLLQALRQPCPAWIPAVSPTVCVRIPGAHAALVASRVWRSIVLPHVVQRSCQIPWQMLGLHPNALPPLPMKIEYNAQSKLDMVTLKNCSAFLQSYGATLDLSDDFGRATFESVARCVDTLQTFQKESCPEAARRALAATSRHGCPGPGIRQRVVYKASFMIHVCMLACNLRSAASLRESIILALRLVLPPTIFDHFKKIVSEHTAVPDKATTSRWRFLLDAALMQFERLRSEAGDKVRY